MNRIKLLSGVSSALLFMVVSGWSFYLSRHYRLSECTTAVPAVLATTRHPEFIAPRERDTPIRVI